MFFFKMKLVGLVNQGAGGKCCVGRARIFLGIRKPWNFGMLDARKPPFPNVGVGVNLRHSRPCPKCHLLAVGHA